MASHWRYKTHCHCLPHWQCYPNVPKDEARVPSSRVEVDFGTASQKAAVDRERDPKKRTGDCVYVASLGVAMVVSVSSHARKHVNRLRVHRTGLVSEAVSI